MQNSAIYNSREDILRFKNKSSDIKGLHILDHSLFNKLVRGTHNGLLHNNRKTKRGKRAGKQVKRNYGNSAGCHYKYTPRTLTNLPHAKQQQT